MKNDRICWIDSRTIKRGRILVLDGFLVPFCSKCLDACVAKMASHAIFQYNVLAIDDIHNTWTNMIIKMIILRLLGSSDDKEKISSSIQEHRKNRRQGIGASDGSRKNRRHCTLVQKGIEAKSAYRHRLNRRSKKGHRCNGRSLYQRRCQVPRRSFFNTGSTDGASVHTTGVMTSASRKRFLQ